MTEATRGLICLDLDGTLLSPKKKVTKAYRTALRDASDAGLAIAFDSGRTPFSVFELMDDLGLVRTCVCLGGAVTFLDGAELFHEGISPDVIGGVIAIAEEQRTYISLSGPDFHLLCRAGRYWPELGASDVVRSHYEYTVSYGELAGAVAARAGRVCKASLYVGGDEAYAQLRAHLGGLTGVEVLRSGVGWADVTAAGCTKADGIAFLAEALGALV